MHRRRFLVASAVGLAGLSFGLPARAAPGADRAKRGGKAKSTILFFLSGGASHVDMWDLKPDAPLEYRGPFQPIDTTAPGLRLCEHLPLLAKQAQHLALVNSVRATVNTNDHHGGYYYNLTGHVPDETFLSLGNNRPPIPGDWPYMGSVVAAKRPPHPNLTNAVTLPEVAGAPANTRPGQFAARLGVENEPLYVHGRYHEPLKFQAPSLTLEEGLSPGRLVERRSLLSELDSARQVFDHYAQVQTWRRQHERAFSLMMSSRTSEAFDVSREPAAIRERYGDTINGMSLLLARRLVEAGVPFVTVFWMGYPKTEARKCRSSGGWDTHASNFDCLKEELLPHFDRGFSALIEDLAERRMLDETLLLVTSEMGRKPKIGDPRSGGAAGAGRDHWTHCMTNVLAGGGIRGGQVYGTSDRFGEHPADMPVTPADIAKTVYCAMGIDDLWATDSQNRPYNLLSEGEALESLF